MSQLKKLSKVQYEIISSLHQIYVTKEGKSYFTIDVFDKKIKDQDEAHIESHDAASESEIKQLLQELHIGEDVIDKIKF